MQLGVVHWFKLASDSTGHFLLLDYQESRLSVNWYLSLDCHTELLLTVMERSQTNSRPNNSLLFDTLLISIWKMNLVRSRKNSMIESHTWILCCQKESLTIPHLLPKFRQSWLYCRQFASAHPFPRVTESPKVFLRPYYGPIITTGNSQHSLGRMFQKWLFCVN